MTSQRSIQFRDLAGNVALPVGSSLSVSNAAAESVVLESVLHGAVGHDEWREVLFGRPGFITHTRRNSMAALPQLRPVVTRTLPDMSATFRQTIAALADTRAARLFRVRESGPPNLCRCVNFGVHL